MDFLAGLMTGQLQASTPGPADDFWYQPAGTLTASGLRIGPEGARKISAWYRGRDILATSLAMLPLVTYRRLPNDEGREAAPQHPLYDVLHRKPNAGEDAFQFKRQAMFDLIDEGWFYADIVDGARGFVDQLLRIDPKRVLPEQVKSGPNRGRWLFHVRPDAGGPAVTKTQDDIFFLRGADGKGILDCARDSLGLGLVLESYASKLFSRGAMSGGILEPQPGKLDEQAMQTAARSWKTAMGDWHMPKVLPPGTKWHASTMEPEKAQMILSRKFTVVDIARWLGIPAHMLGEVETAGVTGLEQRAQEFVTYSLGPWLSLFEFAINDQLVLRPEVYYAEFNRDALVRGDLATRWETYIGGVNAGILAPNEPRVRENLRKMPGMDTPREPQNITGRGARGGPQDNQRPGRTGEPDARMQQAQAIAVASAARLLRKEVAAVQKEAVRHAADLDAFAAAVTEFYAKHAQLVADTLLMPLAAAQAYCAGQASQIVEGQWVAAVETWGTDAYAAGLAELALEEAA